MNKEIKTTIQYVSDIHLEMGYIPEIKKISDNLILAGDIGLAYTQVYKNFIKVCSKKWVNVFVLYGNHEYYNKENNTFTMKEIDNIAKSFPTNVYFMNNYVYYLYKYNKVSTKLYDNEKPIKIIGSVLWSNISNKTAKYLNDYNRIYINKKINNKAQMRLDASYHVKLLTPDITRSLFETNKKYIIDELRSNPDLSCIIVTHHGTHPLVQGYYMGSKLEDGYGTFIPEIFEEKNLIACINGHTHSSVNITLPNGIKLLSNCMGYPGEKQKIVKYNSNAILEIN